MKTGSDNNLFVTTANDDRILPFGRWLRKTKLDEIVELINVLKGDMSLVGTRPPTEDEFKQYKARYKKRLAMKPGITGLWQVSGRSSITDFEDVVTPNAVILEKETFGSDKLCRTLEEAFSGEPDVIEFCGVVTNICVLSNVVLCQTH